MGEKGYTLTEILVVLAIITIILSLTTVSLTNIQQTAYVSTSLETLMSDIKIQQTKAMNGDTEGTGALEYLGIHFESTTYTLFRGTTYDPADPTNFVVSLQGNALFSSVTWPNSQIVFEKGSGEIVGYTAGSDTVTIQNDGGSNHIMTMNQLGVITGIN